jgi:uncharacterized protein (UPF0332 family)
MLVCKVSEIGDLVVKSISEKGNCLKVVFRYPIIANHLSIFSTLTRNKSDLVYLQHMTLNRVTLTVGGYDTGDGFQYTIGGIGNPNVGKRIHVDGSKYPVKLKNSEMVSEMSFSFLEKEKRTRARRFRIRFVNNFMEVRPRPSISVTKELVSLLKETITPTSRVFLASAREKLRSAKVDFVRGSYRTAIHNVYYAVYNAVKSLQTRGGKRLFLEHENVARTLEQILVEIQEKEGKFQELNLDEFSSIIEDARELRELADYGVGFEAGGSEILIAHMLSKAEALITITEYVLDKAVAEINGKTVLHFPQEQDESSFPSHLVERIDLENDLLINSMLVLSDDFNSTVFAYQLLSENDVYYTKASEYFFNGEYFAKYHSGCFSYRRRPGKGYIRLSRETVKKWSAVVKPRELEDLGTCKDNVVQRLPIFFKDRFLEMYAFPDGRFYVLSKIKGSGLDQQLESFQHLDRKISRIISKKWPDYSIMYLPLQVLHRKSGVVGARSS